MNNEHGMSENGHSAAEVEQLENGVTATTRRSWKGGPTPNLKNWIAYVREIAETFKTPTKAALSKIATKHSISTNATRGLQDLGMLRFHGDRVDKKLVFMNKSGVTYEDRAKELIEWCRVYQKDAASRLALEKKKKNGSVTLTGHARLPMGKRTNNEKAEIEAQHTNGATANANGVGINAITKGKWSHEIFHRIEVDQATGKSRAIAYVFRVNWVDKEIEFKSIEESNLKLMQ